MIEKIFLLPQVKRSMIISNKHGMYEMYHKLLNDLKLRILIPMACSPPGRP